MSSKAHPHPHPKLRVDLKRLWGRIEALGEVGAVYGPNGELGCARLALTDEDRDGRDLVVSWMRDLGMSVTIDAIGNVVATLVGREPELAPVMTGSHIDTVRTGGRFDGNLGVLGGLEVVETLLQHGITPRRSIQVAFFTDEEGSRFAPDMLGSLTYIGGLPIEEALDALDPMGIRAGDELNRIGYAGPTPCPAAMLPSAFVELHIEQGPVLEAAGVTIGVVTGVQGISWTELTIEGQSAHAGTTPMALRHDPMAVAGGVIVAMREIALELGGSQVCTVGRLDAFPNLTNVVPSKVVMTLDIRNTNEQTLQLAKLGVTSRAGILATAEGCTVSYRQTARFEPVVFDADMVDLVETTAQRLGHSTMRMPSGAGHDAQMLARVCPTSMIFVESVNGLSHNIAEYTAPDDIEAGANVLLQMMVELAERGDV
jgi:beta-ureidopropionase / N-carbamoyl-L-amino-acid hydrolase